MATDNRLQMEGKWDQMKGRVREAWGVLTDDDMDRMEGKWDRIVGTIREKTGDTVENIEAKLATLFDKARAR